MTFSKNLEKICTALGKNNKPTYVVMAIATVKGICRPLFTMMDKKENPETKKYTAMREGLTEIIAIPVYWACGEFAGKFANKLGKPKNFMDKELYSRYKGGDKSEEVINAFKKAAETADDKLPRMNKNLMFLGVCTAALFVIPALCSVAIKPLMNTIQKNGNSKKDAPQQKIDIDSLHTIKSQPLHTNFKCNNKYQGLNSISHIYNQTKVGAL